MEGKVKGIFQTITEVVKSPTVLTLLVGALIGGAVVGGSMMVSAESFPGGTDNGKTSRIKQLTDDLAALNYGSPSNTPDWGANWNRIATSAKWTPSGDTTPADVMVGKTFYGNNRTQQTGTKPVTGVCPTQAWHDNAAGANKPDSCVFDWVTPTPTLPGDDKKDPNTGLVWSKCLLGTGGAVDFAPSTACTAYSWDKTHANNNGKTAIELCSDRGNGWRLPTQKELMQAYVDGSNYNLVTPAAGHWSATEHSATSAWYTTLSSGSTYNTSKATAYQVRCLR
jgi:hypothetical protein